MLVDDTLCADISKYAPNDLLHVSSSISNPVVDQPGLLVSRSWTCMLDPLETTFFGYHFQWNRYRSPWLADVNKNYIAFLSNFNRLVKPKHNINQPSIFAFLAVYTWSLTKFGVQKQPIPPKINFKQEVKSQFQQILSKNQCLNRAWVVMEFHNFTSI